MIEYPNTKTAAIIAFFFLSLSLPFLARSYQDHQKTAEKHYLMLGFSPAIARQGDLINTLLKVSNIPPVDHTNHLNFESLSRALKSNWMNIQDDTYNSPGILKTIRQEFKSLSLRTTTPSTTTLSKCTEQIKENKAVLIFIGAHPELLCTAGNILNQIKHFIQRTVIVGYPQHSYQLPTMCSMILLNKAIQEPFPLKYSLDEIMTALLNSHNMGNNISSVTNISTNNLEFILNTPTSSNDRLHAFLDSSKLILKGQPAIIIGSNPTVQETELIVKHYGAKHVFTFVLEAGILDHREVLSALGGWIMRDHYINQIK